MRLVANQMQHCCGIKRRKQPLVACNDRIGSVWLAKNGDSRVAPPRQSVNYASSARLALAVFSSPHTTTASIVTGH
jgi:hypothetical protein